SRNLGCRPGQGGRAPGDPGRGARGGDELGAPRPQPVPGRPDRFPDPADIREPVARRTQRPRQRPGRASERLRPPDPGARRRLDSDRPSPAHQRRDRPMNDTSGREMDRPPSVEEFLGTTAQPRWKRWAKYWIPALVALLLVAYF